MVMPRWDDIVGNEEPIARLRALIRENKMPHALLIAGPEGVGKFPAARMAAAALFCQESEAPCGRCASCRAFQGGSHPDLSILEPEGQTIKIEQLRALQAEIALSPYLSARRVVLVRQAEKMTAAAANSLLKTLEEPTGDIIFLLVADSREMLLDTILSRCRIMIFQPLAAPRLAAALEKRGASAALADTLARLAEGSFGRAVRLLEDGGLTRRDRALELLHQISGEWTAEDVWRRSAELAELERGALEELLSYMNLLFRDLLVLHSDERSILLYNADLPGELLTLRPRWSRRRLFRAAELTALTRRMLRANANARLAIEQYLMRLGDI